MRKIFCAFICFISLNTSAQQFDIALSAGTTTALETGPLAFTTYSNKPGTGYCGNVTATYTTKNGFLLGVGIEACRLHVHQGMAYQNSRVFSNGIGYGGTNYTLYKVDVVWGDPAISANLLLGYKIRFKNSALSISAKLGYMNTPPAIGYITEMQTNAVTFHTSEINIAGKHNGLCYGGSIEYQYSIYKAISVGLELSPTYLRFIREHYQFYCLGTQLTLHIKL